MGNYKFKLSDMIPNAWFYKLKDMSKSKKHQNLTTPLKKKPSFTSSKSQIPRFSEPKNPTKFCNNSPIHPKASDTHFPDPPRKSSKFSSNRKTLYNPSTRIASSNVSTPCLCHNSVDSAWSNTLTRSDSVDTFLDLKLPPILTKPVPKFGKKSSKSAGIKLRSNSPKIANKKIQGHGKKTISSSSSSSISRNRKFSESFAIVKSSVNPEKDFRESMVEMIVENNIRGLKELEDLLGCYISLNSSEYHHHIIHAFEHIFLHMNHFRL